MMRRRLIWLAILLLACNSSEKDSPLPILLINQKDYSFSIQPYRYHFTAVSFKRAVLGDKFEFAVQHSAMQNFVLLDSLLPHYPGITVQSMDTMNFELIFKVQSNYKYSVNKSFEFYSTKKSGAPLAFNKRPLN